MNIVGRLYSAAAVNPAKTAIAGENKRHSYHDFISDINNTAEYLKQKGITTGDQVLLAIPVSYKLYVHFAALVSIGAVIVVIDDWYSVKKVNSYLRTVNCKAVIISPKYYLLSYFIKGLKNIPVKISAKNRGKVINSDSSMADITADHPALVTFTTGSTGKPKAAVRTHKVLGEQFRLLDELFSLSTENVLLSNLPIVTLLGFAKGGTAVLPGKVKYNPAKGFHTIIKQIHENKVNCLLGSPAFLLNIAGMLPAALAGQIKKVGIGGATVTPRQWEILIKTFSSAEITIVYGSTEAEPVSACNNLLPGKIINNGVLVGMPVTGVTVKIIPFSESPFDSMPEELPAGQTGEIIVAGPQVVNNYLGGEEIFKHNKIIDGTSIWHRTGDAGYINENGELFFAGRCKWLFTVNGKIYSPLMYELFFETCPGVEEGTAIMVNNNVQVFVATVAKTAAITRLLGDNNLPYNTINVVNHLPKDKRHHSKIRYELLEAMC